MTRAGSEAKSMYDIYIPIIGMPGTHTELYFYGPSFVDFGRGIVATTFHMLIRMYQDLDMPYDFEIE